jgi:hypothetical protein
MICHELYTSWDRILSSKKHAEDNTQEENYLSFFHSGKEKTNLGIFGL